MTHRTIDSITGERMPHGSPVRIEEGYCFLELDLHRAEGVTKRPPQTWADTHEPGEPVKVLVDGGAMAAVGKNPRWLDLHNGRISNADHA